MKKITEASFEIGRKIAPLAVECLVGLLIILSSITGCSDMPFITSVLSPDEVDRYLVLTDGHVVCFQDDLDATCLRLIPETGKGGAAINTPAVHIYPERHVYVFYYEGNPILRAERGQITQGSTGANGDGRENNNGDNGGGGNNSGDDGGNNNNGNGDGDADSGNTNNNGNADNSNGDADSGNTNNNGNADNSNDGHGWIIWVYYPAGTNPEAPPTLSESGVTVTINGAQLTDNDITGFAQFIGTSGEKGIQFFYPTASAELLDLKVRLEGVVDADETAKFNINYLWKSQQ